MNLPDPKNTTIMNTRNTKHLLAAALLLSGTFAAQAQDRYFTRTGAISFFSETPMENIEAHNYKVTSVWDASTGAVEFAALIKAFEFEKALMQEHFNENYMESNTFPKATFKGTFSGVSADQLKKPGTYSVEVKGDLTMHGVTRAVTTTGTIVVDAEGQVKAESTFIVSPEDYDIEIPGMVRDKIAKEIQVNVRIDYQLM